MMEALEAVRYVFFEFFLLLFGLDLIFFFFLIFQSWSNVDKSSCHPL